MSYSNVIRGAAALIGVLIAAQSIAATPEEALVCRYESRSGSHIWSRTCLTRPQWAEVAKGQAADPLVRPTALLPSAGGGPGTVSTVSVNLNR